jgi:thioredoxin 2
VVRTVAEKLAGEAVIVQINSEVNRVLAARFRVRGVPLIVLLNKGKAVAELSGVQSADAIISWFRSRR